MSDKSKCSQLKLSFILWIDKVVPNNALWSFVYWGLGFLGRVEKVKSEQTRKWKFNVEISTPLDLKII